MADKKTELSITIRTVDEATAKLRAINARIDAITRPTRELGKAFAAFGEKSGLGKVFSSLKGVGSELEGLFSKVAAAGGITAGVLGGAAAGLVHIANQYEDLGKKAERLGVGADFLAQMRDAALRTGVPMEALDESLQTFSQNLGLASAHTGRMYKFLGIISPVLRDQVVHAKNNAEAFDLIAKATAKISDPMRRAALAQKVFGDSTLAPLLAKGADGIKALRDHYAALAPEQAEAAKAGAEVGEAMHDLSGATDGVKGALLVGFKPALIDITNRLTKFFTGHRAQIAEWAESIGKKLPGAIQKVAEWLEKAWGKANRFVAAIGGIANVAKLAAVVALGPLTKSVLGLSGALLTAIGRAGQLAAGMGNIPTTVGGGGAAAGAGGAATAGGVGVLTSLALPVAAGFGAKALLKHFGLDDLGGGNEIARRAGPDSFITRWMQEGGYADKASPLELVRNGIDSVRGSRDLSTGGASVIGPELLRGLHGGPAPEPQAAKITIDIKNAPRGTRATVDPGSTADVDLGLGWQLGFAL